MEINDRTFLITGAGSGLGAATAHLFAEKGAKLVIADINSQSGKPFAERLGDCAYFVQTDVRDETSVKQAVQAAVKVFGGLHGVVNCAGILVAEKVLNKERRALPLDSFRKGIEINLVGTFNAIRQAAECMVDNAPDEGGERGVIINTASIAAYEGQIGQACYAASKAGIIGMTLPIARELADYGIRVMTIAPGLFATPILEGVSEKIRHSLAQQIPFPPRLGNPAEFAALALHIVENPMLNGSVIRLDGAMRLAAK